MKKVFSVIIVAFAALFPWSFAAAEEVPCSEIEDNWGGVFRQGKAIGAFSIVCLDNGTKVLFTTMGQQIAQATVPYDSSGKVSWRFIHGQTTVEHGKQKESFFSKKMEDVMYVEHSGSGRNSGVFTRVTPEWMKKNFPEFINNLPKNASVVASSQ